MLGHYKQTQESGTASPMIVLFVVQLNVKLQLNKSRTHPPHLSPKAMRADFNLSRPRDASSCRDYTKHY